VLLSGDRGGAGDGPRVAVGKDDREGFPSVFSVYGGDEKGVKRPVPQGGEISEENGENIKNVGRGEKRKSGNILPIKLDGSKFEWGGKNEWPIISKFPDERLKRHTTSPGKISRAQGF